MSKVLIIGAGAAGMYAALAAVRQGHQVHLFEKNDRAGRKLFITGKGRCNLTNDCDTEEMLQAVKSNRKFLYSSFYTHTNQDVIRFFEENGMPVKIERGGRVFPSSDHSSDVIRTLEQQMKAFQVHLHLHAEVKSLLVENGQVAGITLADGREEKGDACIVATGGFSYPLTGSTGDGYRFARDAGHKVTPLFPSLVPVEAKEKWVGDLMGLSLRNIQLTVKDGKKEVYRDFGEMLFTHFGLSGPVILSATSEVGPKLEKGPLTFHIDLKPALSQEQLDQRILRDFGEQKNRQFKNSLGKLLPSKLIPVVVELSGIPPEKKIHDISREERRALVCLIKDLTVTVVSLRGWSEAIITKGGVSVREIDPATMESKLTKGLYFAGEVLDLDAVTGGFNLQIAWSTAYMAGSSIP